MRDRPIPDERLTSAAGDDKALARCQPAVIFVEKKDISYNAILRIVHSELWRPGFAAVARAPQRVAGQKPAVCSISKKDMKRKHACLQSRQQLPALTPV